MNLLTLKCFGMLCVPIYALPGPPNLKSLAMPMKSIVTENIFKFTMCTASKRLYSTCNLWRHCTDMYNILKWIEDI